MTCTASAEKRHFKLSREELKDRKNANQVHEDNQEHNANMATGQKG